MLKESIIKILSTIKFNRYLLIVLIFTVWIGFFDSKSFLNLYKVKNEISNLEKQKEHYTKKIEEDRQKIKELKTNKKNLEKFAREQYLMKKKNEDIYIITTKGE
ncbi:MAG: septum formation initiator family protein [Marinifilaceae bacterium]